MMTLPYPKSASYHHLISFVLALYFISVRAANRHESHQIYLLQTYFQLPDSDKQFNTMSIGLTKDRCATTADCVPPRVCTNPSSETISCSEQVCACFPPQPRFCTSNLECILGEVCATSTSTAPHCKSAAHVNSNPQVSEFFRPNGTGLTFDSCGITAACRPPRRCTQIGIPDGPNCTGNQNCRCHPPIVQYCSAGSQCADGERCTVVDGKPRCLSLNYAGGELPEWDSSLGLTGDFCRSTKECTADRRCVSKAFEECREGLSCTCIPQSFVFCIQSTICVKGEVCVEENGEPLACYSEQAVPFHSKLNKVEPGLGLLNQPCVSTKDCKPPRECVLPSLDGLCQPGLSCSCQPPGSTGCKGNDDCREGEACVIFEPGRQNCLKESIALEAGYPLVGSNKTTGGNTQTQELTFPEIQRHCIAKHLLDGVPKDELLFEKDAIAHVLCDSARNCATPGHIVFLNGKSMMMKSYCSHVQCVERVMHVNSPRYKKGLRIKGNGDEVEFSALAARYGTRAEEMLLNFALRVGL